MAVLRTLTPSQVDAFRPAFGAIANAGFVRLKGSAGQYLNPSTGELLSRRQYEELHGTAQGTTLEKKAKQRQEQGIGKKLVRLIRQKRYTKIGREHNEFKVTLNPADDDDILARDFIPRLEVLRKRFGDSRNPSVYIRVELEMPVEYDGEKIQERQTRSVNAFNDTDLDIIREDIESLLKHPSIQYKKIRKSRMVWVRNVEP